MPPANFRRPSGARLGRRKNFVSHPRAGRAAPGDGTSLESLPFDFIRVVIGCAKVSHSASRGLTKLDEPKVVFELSGLFSMACIYLCRVDDPSKDLGYGHRTLGREITKGHPRGFRQFHFDWL